MVRSAIAPVWVQGLRAQLRSTVGPAFRVGEQRGKAKLDVRFSDGSRGTAVLPVQWLPAQARTIQEHVERIAQQLALGRTLKQALESITGAIPQAPAPSIASDGQPLLAAWEAFGNYKVIVSRQIKKTTWETVYSHTGKRLEAIAPQVQDAKSLLALAGEAWETGTRRRQTVLQHLAAMCRWAVENELLRAESWTPPSSLRSFLGERTTSRADGVPLTDEQILKLIEDLPQDEAGKRWRFAVELMGAYGLRPVELMHLRVEANGVVWCLYEKRSGGGKTQKRQLRALHPEWAEEWDLVGRLANGERLPPFGGGVAEAARRYLMRHKTWQGLASTGVTCYGFRHGYALRAHQSYGLSVRVAAALMGHSPETHQRCYGRWTDQKTIDTALEAAIRYRNLTQSRESV
jgi:integrase